MPEPISQIPKPEAVLPKTLIIGETPIYVTDPQAFGGQAVDSVTVLPTDKRNISGPESVVVLTRELSRKRGEKKPLGR